MMNDDTLKRLACQVVAMLPENDREARRVLQLAGYVLDKLAANKTDPAEIIPFAPCSPMGGDFAAAQGKARAAHRNIASPE